MCSSCLKNHFLHSVGRGPLFGNGYKFEQIPGDSKGQGSLVCYSPWVCKESDMTEQLNSNGRYSRESSKALVKSTRHSPIYIILNSQQNKYPMIK